MTAPLSIEKTVVVDCSVISAIFWSITLIVSVKYVVFILRTDNDGEGGIMALAALMRGVARSTARRAAFALALGVLERPCSTAARHPPVGGLFGR